MFERFTRETLGRALGCALVGVSLALPVPSVAQGLLTTNTLDLPKTREQASGMPKCGRPDSLTSADMVISALGYAIDKAIEAKTGNPIAIVGHVFREPRVKDWVKSRLGINGGYAACGTVCIAHRKGSRTELGVRAQTIGKGGWSEARNSEGHFDGIGYAYLDGMSYASRGRNSVVCAHVRHWDHDDRVRFQLMTRTV